jgi:hypothetical protein
MTTTAATITTTNASIALGTAETTATSTIQF